MEDMLHISVFSTKSYDKQFLAKANTELEYEIAYFEPRLTRKTATLAEGFEAVCVFVNDQLDRQTLERLAQGGTRLIALRCTGFNNVDLAAAGDLGMTVIRVPAYSPHTVTEHTMGLSLTLIGFDLHGQTVGIIGTGQIGQVVARILTGFSCKILAFDPYPDETLTALGLRYVELPQLLSDSDIITLHCPLTPETRHIVNPDTMAQMKPGIMLINTSRGALLDTVAVIEALKSGQIDYLGLDVYEEEADLFFEDLSDEVIQDDVFMRLLTFPNVMITAHPAFFTRDALMQIAQTTMHNINVFRNKQPLKNEVTAELVKQQG